MHLPKRTGNRRLEEISYALLVVDSTGIDNVGHYPVDSLVILSVGMKTVVTAAGIISILKGEHCLLLSRNSEN